MQLYAMFFSKKYGERIIFKRQTDLIKEITDLTYLRQCIAYVLRNPLVAGLVKSSAGYPWSSQECYFSEGRTSQEYFPMALLTVRQIKANLRTHVKLKDSGYYINNDWMISPKSFVDYKMVESIYGNSEGVFIKYIGWVDDRRIEYNLIIKDIQKYDDIEMKEIANIMSEDKYKKQCGQLMPEQRLVIAAKISRRYRTSAAQMSRVLKVRRELLQPLFL